MGILDGLRKGGYYGIRVLNRTVVVMRLRSVPGGGGVVQLVELRREEEMGRRS